MAATGTPTPNLGLRIPVGTDPASVDDINYNSNLLDTKLGAIGNDSVQDQITTLNSNLTSKHPTTSYEERLSNKTSFSFPVRYDANNSMILIGASGVVAPFCFLISIGASNATVVSPIVNPYGLTVTASLSGTTMTITFSVGVTTTVKVLGI